MKLLLLPLFLVSPLFGQTPVVDFRHIKASSVDVDMMAHDKAQIIVLSPVEPRVFIQNGPLASCEVSSIDRIGRKTYSVWIEFDPILDDGTNGCRITLAIWNRVRRVNLSVFVEE